MRCFKIKKKMFFLLNEYSFWCFGEFFICSNVDVSGAIVRCLEDIGFREVTNNCSVHREKRSSRLTNIICLIEEKKHVTC